MERIFGQKDFLLDCKHFNLIPKFLHINNSFIQNEFPDELHRFQQKILNLYIRRKYRDVTFWKKQIQAIRADPPKNLSSNDLDLVDTRISIISAHEKSQQLERHRRKLLFWLSKKGKTSNKLLPPPPPVLPLFKPLLF